ncbi:MAG: outer membrane protein assembly factor BamA [Vicinamibacterales bacterium]|nr:outer membrane protein assembly factor BamA [Vicinamibacterales bacterium]
MRNYTLVLSSALLALITSTAFAQAPAAAAPAGAAPTGPTLSLCAGAYNIGPPANNPPAGSGAVVYYLILCFEKQGNISLIEPQTYLYYIKGQDHVSLPSRNDWKPYNPQVEQVFAQDFKTLWATNFLTDLSIETVDYPFSNGVVGKIIVYRMEERERIKNIVYNEGTKEIEQSKVEEALRTLGITMRLDSFVDQATEKKVANVVREMMIEKGFQEAKVEAVHEPIAGSQKSVALKFKVTEGPKVKISGVDFVGNAMFSDGKLKKQMKNNKGGGFWIFPGSGVYQEDKFEEDAQNIVNYYRERGYIQADVGQPRVKPTHDSKDGKTRYATLEIPVEEGRRFRIGEFKFQGNTKVPTTALQPLYKLKSGDVLNIKKVVEGNNKAKDIYGAAGYMEFVPGVQPEPVVETTAATAPAGDGIANLTIDIQEGKQYFINRITFIGNTTTRDSVIRREMRLYENNVFNSEALKFSIRRLNQLGYFKPLEDQKNIVTEKTPGKDNMVDLSLKLEEQNRNQLSFGAGVSQYDGLFGQLSFSTSNFMGRGESLTLSMQAGSRAHDYSVAFTEPFLFDRPITGSVDVHKRDIEYLYQFTQGSTGANLTMGFPVKNFTRMFVGYSLDRYHVKDLNQAFFDSSCLVSEGGCQSIDVDNLTLEQKALIARSPYLADSLLIGQGGKRTISKVTPTIALNTVDNPVTPVTGRRYTATFGMAGLGGDTKYLNPTVEGVWFLQQARRLTLGLRAQGEYIKPMGNTALPIFERLVLGGGYSMRGYDLRTVGPKSQMMPKLQPPPVFPGNVPGFGDPLPITPTIGYSVIIGGNKSLLFNAEYLIQVGGPVRLILFYDAGQVKDTGEQFLVEDFITSTGVEVRFFMPVLNVPFRLIFAANPQRTGVINYSTGLPEKGFRFRFDVGSTF